MKLWRYGRAIEQLGHRYRLDGILGSGGMADVCLAWDERDQREVAIKVMKPGELEQRTLDRFLKEATQVARWHHPNIIRIYGDARLEVIDPASGSVVPYIVMEYAQGGDLQHRLIAGEPYPLRETLHIFVQLCSAVAYAHEQGVIHRDLKPHNILFRRLPAGRELVALSDFGLAVEMEATHFTFPGGGTLPYMAPEQLRKHVVPQSDIFALGVILYQLCTGRLPFRRTLQNLSRREPLQPPPPASLFQPELPPALDAVITTALAEDPDDRYPSAHHLWQAITTALATDPTYQNLLNSLGGPTEVMEESSPDDECSSSGRGQARRARSASPTSRVANPLRVRREATTPLARVVTRGEADAAEGPSRLSPVGNSPTPSSPTPSEGFSNDGDPSSGRGQARRARPASPSGPLDLRSRPLSSHPSPLVSPTRQALQTPPTPSKRRPTITTRAPQTRPRRLPRPLLLLPALLLLGTTMLASTLWLGTPNPLALLFPGAGSATITITPLSQTVQDTFQAQLTPTGTPDPAQNQLASRPLSATKSSTRTVTATGHTQIKGTAATGTLTFFNGSFTSSFPISAGYRITAADGIPVTTDSSIVIPKADPNAGDGSATVTAHAVDAGISGNIAALDINQTCCVAGSFVFVKNLQAFTGGQDPKDYHFVQQSDVDGVTGKVRAGLEKQAGEDVQGQVRTGERVAGNVPCSVQTGADQDIGDKGHDVPNANVTVTVTCQVQTYTEADVQKLARARLPDAFDRNKGRIEDYLLQGDPTLTIKAQAGGQLQVTAHGTFLFRLDPARRKNLARLIAGKPATAALTLLTSQPGIAGADIKTASGTLPADPTAIQIIIKGD